MAGKIELILPGSENPKEFSEDLMRRTEERYKSLRDILAALEPSMKGTKLDCDFFLVKVDPNKRRDTDIYIGGSTRLSKFRGPILINYIIPGVNKRIREYTVADIQQNASIHFTSVGDWELMLRAIGDISPDGPYLRTTTFNYGENVEARFFLPR